MFKSPRPLSVLLRRFGRRSLFAASLAVVGAVACSQGENERCEVDRDCKDGLVCLSTGAGVDKTCKSGTTTGTGGAGTGGAATGGSGQAGQSGEGGQGGAPNGGAGGSLGGSAGSSEGGATAGSAGNGGAGG